MKRIIGVIIVIAIVLIGLQLFLTRKSQTQPSGGLQVAASFYPLYFFASQIGGEKAKVTNITPVGVEPHDYEPSPQDLARIQESKLLILNGAGLEPWADKTEGELIAKGVTVVDATEGLELQQATEEHEEEEGEEDEHEEGEFDPHVWLDPVLAQEMARNIVDGFVKVDPANKDYYEAQGEKLIEKLKDLDRQYREGLATCQTRDFVTSHAAFGYLARRYTLTQVGIRGLSPEAEPTAAELAEVVDFAKKNNVKYIFFEELVSPRLSETIAQEVGAQTLVLSPIEGISKEEQAQGIDYFAKMEENLTNLKVALSCQ